MRRYNPYARTIGRCWVCRLPVRSNEAAFIEDRAVLGHGNRPIRRLAHVGDCATELRDRVGGGGAGE